MSSMQRQELILKKMKERGIEVGSGIPNKKNQSNNYRFRNLKIKLNKNFTINDYE